MNVYGYTRVSTEAQGGPDRSLKGQAEQVRAYCVFRGLPLAAIYTDEGESGATPLRERPAGRLLLAALAPGDHVVVSRLDRAWRSALDTLETVSGWRDKQVTFHCLSPSVDTSTPYGKAFLTIAAAFAEMERDIMRERVTEGVRRSIARTGRWGEPPFGWREGAPVAREQEILGRIRDMRRLGLEWAEVAARLNDLSLPPRHALRWSESTVRRAWGKGDRLATN